MPLGCRPTVMVLVCFHFVPSRPSTDTLPWLATLVRGSTLTSVPDETPLGSPSLGWSPPQLVTYTLSGRTGQTMYGATPTGTTCSAPSPLPLSPLLARGV